jgi:hypothetical protein
MPVTGPVPVMFTGELTAHVTGLVALAGAVVTVQPRFTGPANPFAGVAVTVAVLPVVAPAAIVSAGTFSVNEAGSTVSEPVPVDPL